MWPIAANSFTDWLSGSHLVPLAMAVIATVLLMTSLRRRQRQRADSPQQPGQRPAPTPTNEHAAIRRDLDELMVELQELSRRISAEIDTRFAKLEAAIRDADRRIAVLNRLSHHLSEKAESSTPAADVDTRHTVIYELADAGFTAIEIARDLGKTPGEVELILNLRKQSKR